MFTAPLREKCPNTKLFLVRIFPICTEYTDLLHISSYSVRILENMVQEKTPHFGQFSHSVEF